MKLMIEQITNLATQQAKKHKKEEKFSRKNIVSGKPSSSAMTPSEVAASFKEESKENMSNFDAESKQTGN